MRPALTKLAGLALASVLWAGAGGALAAEAATASSTAATTAAPQLKIHFSCSVTREEDTGRVIYVDGGDIDLDGATIKSFQWESALHRRTHGFDCSIDQSDNLQSEVFPDGWRITLKDGAAARLARGYDSDHGLNCAVRLVRNGDDVQIRPTCPALCGSRPNFSELTVNVKNGACKYEQ
jgi:hypothetical protein